MGSWILPCNSAWRRAKGESTPRRNAAARVAMGGLSAPTRPVPRRPPLYLPRERHWSYKPRHRPPMPRRGHGCASRRYGAETRVRPPASHWPHRSHATGKISRNSGDRTPRRNSETSGRLWGMLPDPLWRTISPSTEGRNPARSLPCRSRPCVDPISRRRRMSRDPLRRQPRQRPWM